MKVLPLNPDVEPLFWDHVYQDVPHYYFFILDMTHDSASTELFLALDEQNHIQGMMMAYNKRIMQVRGSVTAVKALLPQITIKKVEIQGLPEHKSLICKKFTKIDTIFDLSLMTVKRGDTLYTTHAVERLTPDDAHSIAALMRQGDPSWWGDITAEDIANKMDTRVWMGIRKQDELVSIGGAIVDVWGSNISTVVTHKDHRNKGYATAVVSTLVDHILKKSDIVLIHVERGNQPAQKAYQRAGFTCYKKYFVARAEL
jgi:ribosomal protein S18 acetylase RimI-like enzyme